MPRLTAERTPSLQHPRSQMPVSSGAARSLGSDMATRSELMASIRKATQPKIELESDSGTPGQVVLRCPKCRGLNLHQGDVRMESLKAGNVLGIEVNVSSGAAQIISSTEVGRGKIQIDFWCEHCNGMERPTATLSMWQHKGLTMVEWMIIDARPTNRPL